MTFPVSGFLSILLSIVTTDYFFLTRHSVPDSYKEYSCSNYWNHSCQSSSNSLITLHDFDGVHVWFEDSLNLLLSSSFTFSRVPSLRKQILPSSISFGYSRPRRDRDTLQPGRNIWTRFRCQVLRKILKGFKDSERGSTKRNTGDGVDMDTKV